MLKNQLTAEEKKVINKSFIISLNSFMCPNNVVKGGRMLALALLPGLKAWEKDEESVKKAFIRNSREFFNTHSVMMGLHTGIHLALEKERIDGGEISEETISSVKAALQGPSAGIGDSLFYNCLRVIIAGVAIEIASAGNILGPILFVLLYGFGQLICKYLLIKYGYIYGKGIIDVASEKGIIPLLTDVAGILGGVMVGSILAGRIKLSLAWAPSVFGATVQIQPLLDSIMPGMLALLLWWFSVKVLQKGWSPIKLIFVIMGACIVLSGLGIL